MGNPIQDQFKDLEGIGDHPVPPPGVGRREGGREGWEAKLVKESYGKREKSASF